MDYYFGIDLLLKDWQTRRTEFLSKYMENLVTCTLDFCKNFGKSKYFWMSLSGTGFDSQFSSVQSLSHVWLFVIPWTAACQASLSLTISRSPPKPMFIESMRPSNHLILCRPLLLLTPISPSMSLFQWVNSLHEVAKVLEFQLQHQSFQRTPRADLL